MRSNLEEAHNTAAYRDAEIIKYREIAKLNGKTIPSSSGEKRLHERTKQLECEEKLNLELAKKLEDQIVITNKAELEFNTEEKLVNSKNEIN